MSLDRETAALQILCALIGSPQCAVGQLEPLAVKSADALIAALEPQWIEWSGGECPVEPMTTVELKFDDEQIETGVAKAYDWKDRSTPEFRIVAYRRPA